MKIIRQMSGRFDHRFEVGPARWTFHDLLWIHTGEVVLRVGRGGERLRLVAPAGVLIFPETPFEGRANGGAADASVCHFHRNNAQRDGYRLPPQSDRMHVQNLIQLSLAYARRDEAAPIRNRLLSSICDCFARNTASEPGAHRLDAVWVEAGEKLARMRSLADVAGLAGLSESAFRAQHRKRHQGPAGRYLQELRFRRAEQLLATTGLTIREISQAVGYAHAESFSSAFSRSRGKSPAAYRRWCKRLA